MTPVIQKLTPKDIDKFIALIRVFEDVFEMKNFTLPLQDHLQKLLEQESFMVFVAVLDNKVIAGLTVYIFNQYISIMPVAYVYDLAVKIELQRQGIGSQLISALKDHCKKECIQEVFVQADKVDEYALDFYRSTGATEEEVVHFTYILNKEHEK